MFASPPLTLSLALSISPSLKISLTTLAPPPCSLFVFTGRKATSDPQRMLCPKPSRLIPLGRCWLCPRVAEDIIGIQPSARIGGWSAEWLACYSIDSLPDWIIVEHWLPITYVFVCMANQNWQSLLKPPKLPYLTLILPNCRKPNRIGWTKLITYNIISGA